MTRFFRVRRELLSPIKELDELEVLDDDSRSSCAEVAKTVADPTFPAPDDDRKSSLGVCPNETTSPVLRQFGLMPALPNS